MTASALHPKVVGPESEGEAKNRFQLIPQNDLAPSEQAPNALPAKRLPRDVQPRPERWGLNE
jgi:hypothetical protein